MKKIKDTFFFYWDNRQALIGLTIVFVAILLLLSILNYLIDLI